MIKDETEKPDVRVSFDDLKNLVSFVNRLITRDQAEKADYFTFEAGQVAALDQFISAFKRHE